MRKIGPNEYDHAYKIQLGTDVRAYKCISKKIPGAQMIEFFWRCSLPSFLDAIARKCKAARCKFHLSRLSRQPTFYEALVEACDLLTATVEASLKVITVSPATQPYATVVRGGEIIRYNRQSGSRHKVR